LKLEGDYYAVSQTLQMQSIKAIVDLSDNKGKKKKKSLTCSLDESKGRLHEYQYLDGPSNFLLSHDTQTSL
jgi:hypothetical protein